MSNLKLLSCDIPLANVLDACVFGIIIIDDSYRIITWNTWFEKYTTFTKDAAIGKKLFELFPDLINTRLQHAINSTLENFSSSYLSQALNKTPFPLRNTENNNENIEQSISIKPIQLFDNRRCCIIQIENVTAAVRRINKLNILKQQAESDRNIAQNLAEMKSIFLTTVSHDLRTPLASITSSLTLLANRITGSIPEESMNMILLAQKNSYCLLQLVNNILDLDKIESGMMSYNMETLNVADLLQQAIENNMDLAYKSNVSFHINKCNKYLLVNADQDRLMQVMCNLMSNAAKFSPPQSKIFLDAALSEGTIRISVTDTGSGINESFRASIFKKFSQENLGNNVRPGGTGLGLAICEKIIHKHDGIIDFICPDEGGTEFFFELKAVTS